MNCHRFVFFTALTGNTRRGDAYTSRFYAALIKGSKHIHHHDTARVERYRGVLSLWFEDGTPGDQIVGSRQSPDSDTVIAFNSCSPNCRAAFLLKYIEGWTHDELASVLNVSQSDADILLQDVKKSLVSKGAPRTIL